MKANWTKRALVAAALVTLAPAAALAQEDVAEKANEIAAQAGELANEVATAEAENAAANTTDGAVADEDAVDAADAGDRGDDDGFDWGLLGLLGLAGLLGLKKNDRDVHVNTTRDNTRL